MRRTVDHPVFKFRNFHLILFALTIFILSCEKEEKTYSDFNLSLDGVVLSPGAVCNQIITDDSNVFNLQSDPNSTRSERFFISDLPVVTQKTEISAADLNFRVLIFDSDGRESTNYIPSDGMLILSPPDNNIIEGTFEMTFVNEENETDIVVLSNGNFKVSYSTYWVKY